MQPFAKLYIFLLRWMSRLKVHIIIIIHDFLLYLTILLKINKSFKRNNRAQKEIWTILVLNLQYNIIMVGIYNLYLWPSHPIYEAIYVNKNKKNEFRCWKHLIVFVAEPDHYYFYYYYYSSNCFSKITKKPKPTNDSLVDSPTPKMVHDLNF